MNKKIVIGTRGSKLALIYAQNAKKEIIKKTDFKEEDIFIKEITTKGDQVQNVRLSEVGGKGLFSSNIERELQEKKIDIAVHALKDMPAIETEGLRTDTFLERNDPREILIKQNKKSLNELKKNEIIEFPYCIQYFAFGWLLFISKSNLVLRIQVEIDLCPPSYI